MKERKIKKNNKHEVGRFYEIEVDNKVLEVVCFDTSDKLAYLCPIKEQKDSVVLDLTNVFVYVLNQDVLVEAMEVPKEFMEED